MQETGSVGRALSYQLKEFTHTLSVSVSTVYYKEGLTYFFRYSISLFVYISVIDRSMHLVLLCFIVSRWKSAGT